MTMNARSAETGPGNDLDQNWDVIVIGSGAGGLTAAVVAAQSGLRCLVVEKAAEVGGTSALSGGVAWIPCNRHMAEGGYPDSSERALEYLTNLTGNYGRPAMLKAYVDNAWRMLDHMETTTEAKFTCGGYPDYKSGFGGAAQLGRSVTVCEYDGRRLGKAFSWLKRPMKELTVFGSMMVDKADLRHLINVDQSFASFAHSTRLVIAHIWQWLLHGRGTRLQQGNALIARLLRSALDAKVRILRATPAVRLITEQGRVSGVVVQHNGKEVHLTARCGVVMASGGFSHNEAFKTRYIAHPENHIPLMPKTNTGDGLSMGIEAGAQIGDGNWHNILGTQAMILRDRRGQIIEQVPFHRRDRPKPGFVLVGKDGKRYINEAENYNHVTHAMNEREGRIPSYIVTDHRGLRRFGIGLVRPGPAWTQRVGKYRRGGHLFVADTIPELATKLGVDPEGLEETIARNNDYAKTGIDPEFGKGDTRYDSWQGDPRYGPNPNLGSIDKPPYYAVHCWPASIGTAAGLVTDEQGRVLDGSGEPIPGFYACGSDMHAVFSGFYPGGGGAIGPAMTFGYLAAIDMIAAQNRDHPRG